METGSAHIALGRLAVLIMVLANAFFVASEFALVTVRKTRMDRLVAEGRRLAGTVTRALTPPDKYRAGAQLGITMSSLGLGWIGEPALARLIEPAFQTISAHYVQSRPRRMPGQIDITASCNPATAEVAIEVRDNGPGIPSESVARLFKRDGLNVLGTGLALLVMSDMCAAHGGRIELRSSTDASNHGTTVQLSFAGV